MVVFENEIVMLTLGLGVFFVTSAYRSSLERITGWPLLETAFRILIVAWTLTILEGFFLPTMLNLLEHACYAFSTVLLAVWCWRATRDHGGRTFP